jgi:hypothetical protein
LIQKEKRNKLSFRERGRKGGREEGSKSVTGIRMCCTGLAPDLFQAELGGASGNYTPQVLYTVPHEVLQYQGYNV